MTGPCNDGCSAQGRSNQHPDRHDANLQHGDGSQRHGASTFVATDLRMGLVLSGEI